MNVFKNILKDDYLKLPVEVRRFHELQHGLYKGSAIVRGSSIFIASFIRWAFNFPVPSEKVAVTIEVQRTSEFDLWKRDFAGRKFTSEFRTESSDNLLR